ncbi:MAG: 50S ribosomal protein L9 [Chloroflexota bacterium]|nr:50S ribosomal protein L9 [Chloroflexota bacterium]
MKVVLIQEVPGLGAVGDVKEVAIGYGRNYLIPQGLAEFATKESMKRIDALRADEEKRQQSLNDQMAGLSNTLEGLDVTIKVKVGGQDRLYGSVTGADIAAEIGRITGQEIDKRKIVLSEAIHQLGEYDVTVKLSRDLAPNIKVIVIDEKAEEKSAKKDEERDSDKSEETAVE